VPAAPYWTRGAGRRLAVFFAGMLATLGLPMIADCLQTSLLRVRLAEADSAAYYLLSRFSDLSAYLALPLVLTLFPYTAEQSARGRSTRPFVWRAAAAQIVFGLALAGLSVFFGSDALALLPGGETHAHRAHLIPRLVATATLTSLYVYQTNAAAAAGRWRFLYWLVPLHLGYAAVLAFAVPPAPSLESLVDLFLAFAAVRALFAAADFLFESRGAQARTVPSPETRYL
jgi:hypothetical protein